jgi:hypothetical protein
MTAAIEGERMTSSFSIKESNSIVFSIRIRDSNSNVLISLLEKERRDVFHVFVTKLISSLLVRECVSWRQWKKRKMTYSVWKKEEHFLLLFCSVWLVVSQLVPQKWERWTREWQRHRCGSKYSLFDWLLCTIITVAMTVPTSHFFTFPRRNSKSLLSSISLKDELYKSLWNSWLDKSHVSNKISSRLHPFVDPLTLFYWSYSKPWIRAKRHAWHAFTWNWETKHYERP